MALFSAVLQRLHVACTLTRQRDGLLVDVNAAWVGLTGFSREHSLGKTTIELGIWEDGAKRASRLLPLHKGQTTLKFEDVLTTHSGAKRPVQVLASQHWVGGEPHLLCEFIDVTGQQDSAQVLQDKLDFIEKLTNRVSVMLFQFRMRADGSSHFPFISKGFRQVLGVSAQDVIEDASRAFAVVHPDDVATIQTCVKSSMTNMTPWQQEFRVMATDGAYRWLYGDSVPQRQDDGAIMWYGTLTDITRRKLEQDELMRVREKLVEQANTLTVAMDHMSDGFLSVNPQGKLTRYNQRFLELLDIPQEVMNGIVDGADLIQFQKDRGDFGENFTWVETGARADVQSANVRSGPERYIRKTRSGRTLEIRSRSLPDGGGVRTFSDVTHFLEAQSKLYTSETRFRSLTALSSDWFWEQDENFRFVRVDGYDFDQDVPSSDFVGRMRWEFGNGGLTESQWDEHRNVLAAHKTFRDFEFQRRLKDGSVLWASISGAPVFASDGSFTGYRGIGRDITAQKQREEDIVRLAFYDPLTNLPNRRLLLDRLAKALVTSGRSQTRGALLFIDLDNFKDLNDTMGHDVGDQLLEKVANRLSLCVRQGDTVARFGGDEFVVMLVDLSAEVGGAVDQVKTVGEKILETLNLPFELRGHVHFSTPSIGMTLFSGQHQSVDDLLKRADLAMYQAKEAGRNTMRFFDPEMQAAVARRAALELDLRHGLERQEFVLHYHAVMNREGSVVGVEALVRWLHPQRGRVMPFEFIPAAEQSGLIMQLGYWVLKSACDQLVLWSTDALQQGLTISINISARQFRHAEFVTDILGTLKQTGANPHRLKLELTETLLLTDVHEATAKMQTLREAGVRFALDDFGTGYSSLSYLKNLPLDELKIDQSFVRDLLTDSKNAAIALTVLALGLSLGLDVVAEGVETQAQLDYLAQHGCEFFQGYLFGQPVPVDELQLDSKVPGFPVTLQGLLP
jgi:diguanylate cyclase (GGDEF)-like protein/PAS domain S-box-containing protein